MKMMSQQQHLKHSQRFIETLVSKHKTHQSVWQHLPTATECWNVSEAHSGQKAHQDEASFAKAMKTAQQYSKWTWPKRPIFFIADPHADAEAFIRSLVATGGIKITNQALLEFKLTRLGREATFIIGGDCLDKGPSNLALLDALKRLFDTGARVKLLAGNHDMRLYMGIYAMSLPRHPSTEHFFVRMGEKVIPLLSEVHQRYLKGKKLPKSIPDEASCKEALFPRADWFEQFPQHAKTLMTHAGIKRELRKMQRKYDHFEAACKKAGFSMQDVYATAMKCRQLFLHPKGDYAWFFKRMQLSYRRGSFLFLHAGLDDEISKVIEQEGVAKLNKQFRQQMKNDLFQFYYGSLANTMRTKYRDSDLPLSGKGVKQINRKGIHALVQGHINRKHGQRLVLKHGLLHVESDVTLDRHSRHKEGLEGVGAGVTIIHPDQQLIGLSIDYPFAKVFHPHFYKI
ncbi:metallophosphoesterase [Methylophaga sp. UBA678]|uniref:metallophosphoesterase n=1 Tax=Methylophaga sp. UBA678 TaxID=1946901 RepID=UPI00259CB323|nr:metallophosphoesterase [Methylophaga sp. UBA678]|tara:strand:- start:66510 stop:67874 length:1365 start_codon:yes stop_codon:yes gene_type:complete